mgnify:CR=1 FL=1
MKAKRRLQHINETIAVNLPEFQQQKTRNFTLTHRVCCYKLPRVRRAICSHKSVSNCVYH